MYKAPKHQKTKLTLNNSVIGESIETKVNRILNNNEPITDNAPRIYTPSKDGVKPEHDIRTDKWEIAVETMGKVAQMRFNKREEKRQKTEPNTNEPKPGHKAPGANTND